ncbi:MAG: hypothetical protein JXR73_05490, partial [Candidatus Omnitrophica bacterium]|nr:hypothetical protein [Candidatus Omnitrophota bacterium]
MQSKLKKSIGLFFTLFLSASGFGQELVHWRIWNDPGNPVGAYVGWFDYSQSGRLYVTSHFEGGYFCSWMDGYSIHVIDKDHDIARIAKESSDGVVWTLDVNVSSGQTRGFSRFEFEGENQIRKTASYEIEELRTVFLSDFLPRSQDKVLFLFNDELIEFDADANETRILKRADETNLVSFIHMREGREGAVWISGEKGLAKLTEMESRTIPRDPAEKDRSYHWEEFTFPPDSPYRDLAFPIEAKNGEIWGAAFSEQIGKRILLGFDGEKWSPLFQDENNDVLIGWPGKEKDFWLLKDAALASPFSFHTMKDVRSYTLSHVVNRQEEIVSRKDDLSGYIRGMAVEPNGPFWLSVRGVARYAPPIWETPDEVKHLEKPVYTIYEDKQRRLFFAYEDRIVVLDKEDWREYLLPDNKLAAKYTQQSIASWPDGRIAIITYDQDLLFMTLRSRRADFSVFLNPENRKWELIAPDNEGNIWIISSDQETGHHRLDSYDGENFTTVINDIHENYMGHWPNHILEAPDGGVWMAVSNGIRQWRNGKLQAQGRYDLPGKFSGVFCIALTPDGALWAGEHNKLLEFSGSDWEIIKTGLANVHDIIVTREGGVWVASQNGVHRYKNGYWVSNTHEDGLATSRTYKLLEDSRGRIWAGTASGLSLYDKTADLDPPQTYLDPQKNADNFLLDENINIAYSGMDKWNYTPPDRLLYSYRVDEGAWSL